MQSVNIKNQNYNAKFKILRFLIVIFIFAFYIFNFNAAEEALIVQSPKYIGLNSGLVGYWSFDGLNTLSTALDATFTFAIMTLLTPPALSLDCAGFCL